MKTRKLLSLLLALVMVLSVVSFASAAQFSDVPEDLEGVVARLVGLGIINGYPDGTFRPENNITRAEFAKIAVMVLGLETTAKMLANVPSKFSDVKVTDWYNPYINVATNQGILKGYPDGTFKPNNYITQAEALTIVLRLLGYSDNLPGDWPYNYVIQADKLGLIDDDFAANVAATRGIIVELTYKALEQNIVSWNSETGFVDQGKTLLAKALKGAVSDLVEVEAVSTSGTKYYTMTVNGTDLDVSKDVAVSGSSFANLANHKVIYTTVNGVVVAIEVQSKLVTGKVTKTAGRVITIGDTEVVYASGLALPTKDQVVSAWVYDGKAYKAIVHAEAQQGTITNAGSDSTGKYVEFDFVPVHVYFANNAAITLNGKTATFDDLAAGQFAVYELKDGKIVKLDAYSETVDGIVDSWTAAGGFYTKITLNGKEYKVAAQTIPTTISTPTGDEVPNEIVIGAYAILTLNTQGEVVAITQYTKYATAVIGDLDTIYTQATSGGRSYFILLKDGVSYDITDVVTAEVQEMYVNLTKVDDFNALLVKDNNGKVKDSIVKIQYNAAGKVIRVDVFVKNYEIINEGLADADSDGVPDVVEALTGMFTTYTTNGAGYKLAPMSDVVKYVITWNVDWGYAANVNAITIEDDINEVENKVVSAKGKDLGGNYIVVELERYYFDTSVSSAYDDINVNDKVSFKYYETQAGTKFIVEIEVTDKYVPGEEDEEELPETVVFNGIYKLDNNDYILLDDVFYPYVGESITDIEVGATVIATYATIRGEVVVIKIEEVEDAPEPVPADKLAFSIGSTGFYDYEGASKEAGKVSFTFTDKSKFEALYEHGLGYGGKEFTHTDADGKATTETATWKYALVPFDVTEDIGDVASIEVYSDADYTTKVGDVTYFDLTESHNVYRISAIRIAEKDSDQWKYLGDSTAYVLIELADGKQYTVEVAVSVTGAAAGDVLLDLTPEP